MPTPEELEDFLLGRKRRWCRKRQWAGDIISNYDFLANPRNHRVAIKPMSQERHAYTAAFIRDARPFVTLDCDDLCPELESFVHADLFENVSFKFHLDLNIVSVIDNVMNGELVNPPYSDKDPKDQKGQERFNAFMMLSAMKFVRHVLAYDVLIPEFASKNGKPATDLLLDNLAFANHIGGRDVWFLINGLRIRREDDRPIHDTPYDTDREAKAAGRFTGNYRNMLMLADMMRMGMSPPKGVNPMLEYMDWLHHNSFRSTAAIISAMYVFANHEPRSILPKVRKLEGQDLLSKIANQAWDCTHIMSFVHPEVYDKTPNTRHVFCTFDQNLKAMVRYMHQALISDVNIFSHHFPNKKDQDLLWDRYKQHFQDESCRERAYNQETYESEQTQDIARLEIKMTGRSGYTETTPFSLP
jgi:hypothetical protein